MTEQKGIPSYNAKDIQVENLELTIPSLQARLIQMVMKYYINGIGAMVIIVTGLKMKRRPILGNLRGILRLGL